jgi:cytochrome bd-type quinol oxidase subunit 2
MIISFYILFLLLISVYGVLASIETGIALTMLFPKLSNNSIVNKNIYTPIWEITNVFLVFASIIVAVIFNNALSRVSQIAFVPIFLAGAGLLLRAIIGMYIFYSKNKASLAAKLLLIISSYLVPLSVSVIGIDLFIGNSVWSTNSGRVLLLATFLGITVIGLAFANRHKLAISVRSKYLLYTLFALWAIDLGFMLPHSLMFTNSSLLRTPLTILIAAIAISTVAFFLYSAAKNMVYELYQYVILIGFIAPILLGLDLRPYFINHTITIKQAYGAAAYQSSMLIGTIICLPIVVIGFYILIKLLLDQRESV